MGKQLREKRLLADFPRLEIELKLMVSLVNGLKDRKTPVNKQSGVDTLPTVARAKSDIKSDIKSGEGGTAQSLVNTSLEVVVALGGSVDALTIGRHTAPACVAMAGVATTGASRLYDQR